MPADLGIPVKSTAADLTAHEADVTVHGVDTTKAKGFVNHGATAGTARPSGFASIEWTGSVTPTNAVDGDTWINTA